MSKNEDSLLDFVNFCCRYKQLRFWQALRTWSGFEFILVSNERSHNDLKDTFYFGEKNK